MNAPIYINSIQKQPLLLLILIFSTPLTMGKFIQKQPLLLLIYLKTIKSIAFFNIQKQPLLLLILSVCTLASDSLVNSKTTFVTVNRKSNWKIICVICYSKTTFVTVNPSFLKALYFII